MTALRDWVHVAADIGDVRVRSVREATEDERIELARELDIPSCESLSVAYEIQPSGRGRARLTGTLEAEVTQTCVVSLEPVPLRLSETLSIELGPPEALDDEPAGAGDREISSLPDVEPVEDGRIDVGSLVFAILSAALPPYPRKSDAAFDWVDPKIAADPGAASPFAALSKLKPKA